MKIIERDSVCPGCYHNGEFTPDCSVYLDYGQGVHWFIQPSEDPSYIQCDFCGGDTLRNEELDVW